MIIKSRYFFFLAFFSLALFGCTSNQSISVVTGALSTHLSDRVGKLRDEENSLLAFEVGKTLCGGYDNSRIRKSYSLFCSYRWLDYQPLAVLPLSFNSKVGASLYDNQSGYNWSLKPIGSIGARLHTSDKTFMDFDYMPGTLLGGTDVATVTFGYSLRGK